MTKRKNVSKKIKSGRTMQTRDEFFEGAADYRKPGYENKGYYRRVVVVDSNNKDELAVTKLHKPGQSKPISGERSTYKPFVETKDDEGKPIKAGRKFILNKNKSSQKINKHAIEEIKRDVFKESKNSIANRNKVREMKGRGKLTSKQAKRNKKSTGKNPHKPKT